MRRQRFSRILLAIVAFSCAFLAGAAIRRAQDACGPFSDVSALYCPYVLEAFYTDIAAGTSATTFSPDVSITRAQAVVFTTKGLNQALARGSRRAALGQWWTTQSGATMAFTDVGNTAVTATADGKNVWVLGLGGPITSVSAENGEVTSSWAGVFGAGPQTQLVVAMGSVFTTGFGHLYMAHDTGGPGGKVTTVADTGTGASTSLTFDGGRFWVTDQTNASVHIVTPGPTLPWAVQTIDLQPAGPAQAIFDGANVWLVDRPGVQLMKMNADGSVALAVSTGVTPGTPTFDGSNIWVPAGNDSLFVIRVRDGFVVSTLTGNGLFSPLAASFDGQRILVTNVDGNSVSVWNAANLAPIGTFSTLPGGEPRGVCSDGINFWIAFGGTDQLGRF